MKRSLAIICILSSILVGLSARSNYILDVRMEQLEQEWNFGSLDTYRAEERLLQGALDITRIKKMKRNGHFGKVLRVSIEVPVVGQRETYDEEYGLKVEESKLPVQETPLAFEFGAGLSYRYGRFLFVLTPDIDISLWSAGFPSMTANLGLSGSASYIFSTEDDSIVRIGAGFGYDPSQYLYSFRISTGDGKWQDDYSRLSFSVMAGIVFD